MPCDILIHSKNSESVLKYFLSDNWLSDSSWVYDSVI